MSDKVNKIIWGGKEYELTPITGNYFSLPNDDNIPFLVPVDQDKHYTVYPALVIPKLGKFAVSRIPTPDQVLKLYEDEFNRLANKASDAGLQTTWAIQIRKHEQTTI